MQKKLINSHRKFLYIEGGGSRTKIAICLLAKLEQVTGLHVTDIFDSFGGLSAGGLIVSLLNIKNQRTGLPRYTAKEISENWLDYMNYEPNIENNKFLEFIKNKKSFNKEICKSDNFFKKPKKYIDYLKDNHVTHNQMIDWYSEYLVGLTRLSDTIRPIYVNSFSLNDLDINMFTTNKAKKFNDENFYIKDVIRSAVAFVGSNDIAKVVLNSKIFYFTDQIYVPGFNTVVREYKKENSIEVFNNTKFMYLGTAIGMGEEITSECDIGFGYKKPSIFKSFMESSGIKNKCILEIMQKYHSLNDIINKEQEFFEQFVNKKGVSVRAGIADNNCYIFEPDYQLVGKLSIAFIDSYTYKQYSKIADMYFEENKSKILNYLEL